MIDPKGIWCEESKSVECHFRKFEHFSIMTSQWRHHQWNKSKFGNNESTIKHHRVTHQITRICSENRLDLFKMLWRHIQGLYDVIIDKMCVKIVNFWSWRQHRHVTPCSTRIHAYSHLKEFLGQYDLCILFFRAA